MKLLDIFKVTCACLLTAAAPQVAASYVYTYTGNTFDVFTDPTSFDNTNSVYITLELPSLLAPNMSNYYNIDNEPTSYTMTAGNVTITDQSASDFEFFLVTDEIGNITMWDLTANVYTDFQTIGDTNLTIDIRNTPLGNSDFVITETCTLSGDCNASPIYDVASASSAGSNWQVSQVPIPPAVWLFGTGLLSLISVARRKARL